jgi:hypothetical protein
VCTLPQDFARDTAKPKILPAMVLISVAAASSVHAARRWRAVGTVGGGGGGGGGTVVNMANKANAEMLLSVFMLVEVAAAP